MKKLALALLLALSADTFAPAVAGHTLHALGTRADGVYRRPEARGKKRKVAARRRRGRGRLIRATEIRLIGQELEQSPAVTEIDADGLKNLLARGDAQTARPLLLNFWATWCAPCRKEFPDLVKIGADYSARGVQFALVSADDVSEIQTSVPKFLRQMRASAMPAYLLNATDTEAAISQIDTAWGGELPATFLFDRQGKLAYKHFGIIDPAELREAIEKVVTSDK
ncbi:MAG TPA: redoxin domain-containing protein [Pyrinomonadaceae bacterium]